MLKKQKIKKTCLHCNIEFFVRPCEDYQKFCKRRCFYDHRIENGIIKKWSRNYDKCINCETTKYKHHVRGYCTKCHSKEPLLRKKSIERWPDYYSKNKENIKNNQRKYRKTINGRSVNTNNRHKRRVQTKQVETDITTEWLKKLWINTTDCELCGKKLENNSSYPNGKHLDHIIPLLAGEGLGLHIKSNVRYICALCNVTR